MTLQQITPGQRVLLRMGRGHIEGVVTETTAPCHATVRIEREGRPPRSIVRNVAFLQPAG